MIRIHPAHRDSSTPRQVSKPDRERSSTPLLIRIYEIPNRDHERTVRAFSNERMLRNVVEALRSKRVKQSEVIKAWLVNTALGAQSEMSFKGLRNWSALLKNIREGPEGHHVHHAVTTANSV